MRAVMQARRALALVRRPGASRACAFGLCNAAGPLQQRGSRAKHLWTPSPEAVARSAMVRFAAGDARKEGYGGPADSYKDLHEWSVANPGGFHAALWASLGIKHSQPYSSPLEVQAGGTSQAFRGAQFYPGARLNFAENVLRYAENEANRDKVAMLWYSEVRPVASPRRVTYGELRDQVAAWVGVLRQDLGVGVGDAVCGYLPLLPETVFLTLATTAVGATWSSCSPDFGHAGALDRFSQVRPKAMFACSEYFHKGKRIDLTDRLTVMCESLQGCGLKHTVLLEYEGGEGGVRDASRRCARSLPSARTASDLVGGGGLCGAIEYEQVGVSHPVYTMFSSGTTGMPKAMQQGFGVLVTHLKEHVLHHGMSPSDVYFQFTTTGWMMYNYKVSALATGATLVLYDGDPMTPRASALWDVMEHSRTTVFGTSARYLSAAAAAGLEPTKTHNLALRMVQSTGSPASGNIFEYVDQSVAPGAQYCSISGGTDLNGCFVCGNVTLPVTEGEIQCRALGMDVRILDDDGRELGEGGGPGELCCKQPFASQPLRFLNDPDGQKYHAAYFEAFDGIWAHGDFAELTQSGGVIIHGRSDATLNPGGVRIGTAEIYAVVERSLPDIVEDSVVVGMPVKLPDGTPDVDVVMFCKMQAGVTLDKAAIDRIRTTIRQEASPRHVPKKVLAAPELPTTTNGKKVEIAVRKALLGQEIKNRGALANPASLDFFYNVKL